MKHAHWDESTSAWHVDVDEKGIFECDVLINACGILNNIQWPKLAGLECFGGRLCHTAAWDNSIDLRNKRVAVVGAGASAVQLLPAIQDEASRIDIYIRTPSWITTPLVEAPNGEVNPLYSDEERMRFANDAAYSVNERKKMEAGFNRYFRTFWRDSVEQQEIRSRLEVSMRRMITKSEYREKLIPTFDVGCRRINPSVAYLETLQRDHVQPIFDPIDEVTSTGIMSGGLHREVDIIIAATGFDTSFRPRFPIVNGGGQDLRELWKDEPEAYMGLAVSGFPNYLMFLGPNTPLANGSVIGILESTADFFVRLIRKMIQERILKFDVSKEAQVDFDQHTQRLMQKMVWTSPCNSWYRSKSGKVTAIWPGSSLHYIQTLEANRWEDWNLKYQGNRYEWWGPGFSKVEAEADGDLAYYIKQHEPLSLHAYYKAAANEQSSHGPDNEFRLADSLGTINTPEGSASNSSSCSAWVNRVEHSGIIT